MRVAVERIALNSDAEFFRGLRLTAVLPTYQPLSPSPTVGAAHNTPRPPPERVKIAAIARASRANHRRCIYSRATPTPSEHTSSDRTWRRQEDYYVTEEGATKGAARVTHHTHRYHRTADKTRTRQTTKGGHWPGRQDLGNTTTARKSKEFGISGQKADEKQ